MGDSSFAMNGGDDAYSYTHNSQIQKEGSDCVKLIISEAIMQKLELKNPSTVKIADLGCSVGPNTISTVEHLINAVKDKYRSTSTSPPTSSKKKIEFQVFFNEHASNDFNTLFASLGGGNDYYAAGVAGSFHARVFPRASIALAHSSYALHWLSGAPLGVLSEGRIVRAGDDGGRASKVYLERFQKDVGGFMSARAEEIMEGGLMFLLSIGIVDGHFLFATTYDIFRSSLTELVAEGVIDKAEVESFNFPVYVPSEEEMRKVIEKNGSFNIERVELMTPRSEMSARDIIIHLRAATGGVFAQHFGESVMDKMFSKSLLKVEEEAEAAAAAASTAQMVEADLYNASHLFYVLKRN